MYRDPLAGPVALKIKCNALWGRCAGMCFRLIIICRGVYFTVYVKLRLSKLGKVRFK